MVVQSDVATFESVSVLCNVCAYETSFTLNTISSSHSLFLLFNFAKGIGGAGLMLCDKRKVLLAMHFIFCIKVIQKKHQ